MAIITRLLQWMIDRLTVSYRKLDESDPLVTSRAADDEDSQA